MSKRLTEAELLDSLFEFEKTESATIEKRGTGRWGFMVAWNAPKDGKISRPIGWRPSREAWERMADKQQAPFRDGSFYNDLDTNASRKTPPAIKSVSTNAPRNRRDGDKSSSTHRDGFDFDVVTI